jgi:hypothetical protein
MQNDRTNEFGSQHKIRPISLFLLLILYNIVQRDNPEQYEKQDNLKRKQKHNLKEIPLISF